MIRTWCVYEYERFESVLVWMNQWIKKGSSVVYNKSIFFWYLVGNLLKKYCYRLKMTMRTFGEKPIAFQLEENGEYYYIGSEVIILCFTFIYFSSVSWSIVLNFTLLCILKNAFILYNTTKSVDIYLLFFR